MNEPSKLSPYGVGLLVLFFSWFLYPVVLVSVSCLIQPVKVFGLMGVIYFAYVVSALYFGIFSTLSIVKYHHPHWVRILYACGMMCWCFTVHYIVLLNIASC